MQSIAPLLGQNGHRAGKGSLLSHALLTSCVHRHVDAERSSRQGLAWLHCSTRWLLRLNRRRHLWQHRQAGATPGQVPPCDAVRGAVRIACGLLRWNGGLPPRGRFRWGSSHPGAWWYTCALPHQINAPHRHLTYIFLSFSPPVVLKQLGAPNALERQGHCVICRVFTGLDRVFPCAPIADSVTSLR